MKTLVFLLIVMVVISTGCALYWKHKYHELEEAVWSSMVQ